MSDSVAVPGVGIWECKGYIPFISEWEAGDDTVKVGTNIKLTFTPANTVTPSSDIRIIQFKNPIIPDAAGDSIKWWVDRRGTYNNPYFGWLTMEEVGKVTDTGLVGTMGDLSGEVGHVVAQKGSKPSNAGAKSAYVIDFPREPVKIPDAGKFKSATYTTFAYDLTNGVWLSGVKWGYSLSSVGSQGEKPVVTVPKLGVRSKKQPPAEESAAAIKFNTNTNNAEKFKVPSITQG